MQEKPNDYHILDVANQCDEIIAKGGTIYQKWTCINCNSRQTMEEPNKLFTSGRCEECKFVSPIERCNFLAIFGKGSRP
jgi:hypothetical protein